jgi:hypothetical protein
MCVIVTICMIVGMIMLVGAAVIGGRLDGGLHRRFGVGVAAILGHG